MSLSPPGRTTRIALLAALLGGCTTQVIDHGGDHDAAPPVCGNGAREPGEECDDGNQLDGDACDADCTLPAQGTACGNGTLDLGEYCDTGGQSSTCDADCTAAECGDDTFNPAAGEQCDDGNRADGDGCASTCMIAGARWQEPQLLDRGWAPEVAIAGNGDLFVVYGGEGLTNWARRLPYGSDAWDPAFQIGGPDFNQTNPYLAVDDHGNAMVVWTRGVEGFPMTMARFDRAGGWPGGWTRSEVRPAVPDSNYWPLGLTMTGNGYAVAVWLEDGSNGRYQTMAALFDPAVGWQAPHMLSLSPTIDFDFRVALTPLAGRYRAVLAWIAHADPDNVNGSYVIDGAALTYDPVAHTSAWTGITHLTSAGDDPELAGVGIDRAGRATVLYQVTLAGGSTALDIRTHDGIWSAPTRVSGAERADRGSLSVDGAGSAMIAWRRCEATCDLAVRRHVGGAWQPPESLAAVDVDQSFVTMSDEHALLFWEYDDAVWGRALTPAGWSAERRIAGVPGASDGYALDAVVLSSFGGVAAWQRLTFDTLVNEIITVRFAP